MAPPAQNKAEDEGRGGDREGAGEAVATGPCLFAALCSWIKNENRTNKMIKRFVARVLKLFGVRRKERWTAGRVKYRGQWIESGLAEEAGLVIERHCGEVPSMDFSRRIRRVLDHARMLHEEQERRVRVLGKKEEGAVHEGVSGK
ncbi:MAG: uncharacterized protein A8A55_2743 [Amphiamblys sp. WSBS2006]|nr:MAG: uncharacterized protein A8A55_2743 [Amphiamblys sp. WSBS2006]